MGLTRIAQWVIWVSSRDTVSMLFYSNSVLNEEYLTHLLSYDLKNGSVMQDQTNFFNMS